MHGCAGVCPSSPFFCLARRCRPLRRLHLWCAAHAVYGFRRCVSLGFFALDLRDASGVLNVVAGGVHLFISRFGVRDAHYRVYVVELFGVVPRASSSLIWWHSRGDRLLVALWGWPAPCIRGDFDLQRRQQLLLDAGERGRHRWPTPCSPRQIWGPPRAPFWAFSGVGVSLGGASAVHTRPFRPPTAAAACPGCG